MTRMATTRAITAETLDATYVMATPLAVIFPGDGLHTRPAVPVATPVITKQGKALIDPCRRTGIAVHQDATGSAAAVGD